LSSSVFQKSALMSGLLTQEEIDEALEAIRAGAKKPFKHISDERLAHKLVELGRLNRWQAEQLRAGRTKFQLGPYFVIDSCGRGGMGEVYKAEHRLMGRVVAIKVLPRHKSTPEAIENFIREIRAQAQLDHENLVRAYDAGQDGSVHFLVTEYVPGTDLRRWIRRHGRLSMQAAASIITQAARGLEHAHQRGLLHRDVKPGNILVTPEGVTKVSDLGLAGHFGDSQQLGDGKVIGTADYLAPEQILTPDKLTPALDIYSLGCTLYYAVTAKVPFPGGTAKEKARAHCSVPPLDPRRLNPDLDDAFVDVMAAMMAKNPEERIQTAAEVVERLAPWFVGVIPPYANVKAAPTALQGADISTVRAPIAFNEKDRGIMVPRGGHPAGPGEDRPLKDTEPGFFGQPVEEPGLGESPSQISVGTASLASAIDETLPPPPIDYERYRYARRSNELALWVKVLIGVGAVLAVCALAVALVGSLR
jgi:hypothetical protein